jgi:hypothetical protein
MKIITSFVLGSGLLLGVGLSNSAYAAKPLWTYTPLSETRITVSPDGKAQVKYRITNNSKRTYNLSMMGNGMQGVTSSPATCQLKAGESCEVTLEVDGSKISPEDRVIGPTFCTDGNVNHCYQPAPENLMVITSSTPRFGSFVKQVSPATPTNAAFDSSGAIKKSSTQVLFGAGVGINSSNAGSGTTGVASLESQTKVGTTNIFNTPTTINAGVGISGNFGQITGGSTTQGIAGTSTTTTQYNPVTHQMDTITTTTPGTAGGTQNQLSNMGTLFGKVGGQIADTQLNVLAGVSTVSNSGNQNTGITTGVEVAQSVTKCGTQLAATYTNTQISQAGLFVNTVGLSVKVPVDSCTFGSGTTSANANATDPANAPNPNIVGNIPTDTSGTVKKSSETAQPVRHLDQTQFYNCYKKYVSVGEKDLAYCSETQGFSLDYIKYKSCIEEGKKRGEIDLYACADSASTPIPSAPSALPRSTSIEPSGAALKTPSEPASRTPSAYLAPMNRPEMPKSRMLDDIKFGQCRQTGKDPAACVRDQGMEFDQSRYESCLKGRPNSGSSEEKSSEENIRYCAGWAAR